MLYENALFLLIISSLNEDNAPDSVLMRQRLINIIYKLNK